MTSLSIETITPKAAAQLLDGSTNTRNVREAWVNVIARSIKEDRWDFNGETIKIDPEGNVIDGQHRLWACIQSDRSIKTAVARNVESDVYVDIGHSRTATQLLQAQGHTSPSAVSSVARSVWFHNSEFGITALNNGRVAPDRFMIVEATKTDQQIARSANKALKARAFMPTSVLGYVHYIAVQAMGGNTAYPDMFVDQIALGTGAPGSGPTLLRDRMVRQKITRARMPRLDMVALTTRAWNQFLSGKTARNLLIKGKRDGRWCEESMPRVKGIDS